MRKELTFTDLDSETVELLPARETLFYGNNNWAAIYASNSSMAFNAASRNFHREQLRGPVRLRQPALITVGRGPGDTWPRPTLVGSSFC